MKKKAELGLIIIGCILIIACGYFIVKQGLVSDTNSTKKVGIYVDGTFEEVPYLELPIDLTEAETIVKEFCEPLNQDYMYGYESMKKINNEWRIPIINVNCPCYATIDVETGKTTCMKEIPFTMGIIPEQEVVLKIANQLLHDECDKTFTKIEKTSITKTFAYQYLPGTNKENVCQGITEYLSDYSDIWMAEKTLITEGPVCDTSIPAQCTKGKLISAIVLVGLEGDFVCGYAIDYNAPLETKILFLDEVCEKKETDDTYKIYMKSRQFIPKPGISDALNSAIATTSYEQMHILLQFHHLPGNDERSKLSGLNITLCGYIHNNAYLASIPTSYLTEISNLSFIRWIGDILPEDKISSYIREDKIGNWAVNEDGTVNLIIQFFDDISLDDAEQVITQYGGITNSKVRSINTLVVSISKDRITELANEDIVQWIEQVSPPATTDDINLAE